MKAVTPHALYRRICNLSLFTFKSESTDAGSNRWKIVASVCLERFPIICPELDATQRRYKELVNAVELENSLLSEHEVRLMEDQKRLEQRKTNLSDDTEESVITAQDFEDSSSQELEAFKKRYMLGTENVTDKMSLKRCLSRKLVLAVYNPTKKRWLFPEAYLNGDETLYETSRRAISTVLDADQFLLPYGYAPIGFHKFKYPKPVAKQNNAIGEKVCQMASLSRYTT
ncbi:MRP-L46 domain containing protein [Trichuris trichiura]|uniref:MRP-L46 domain containing protein n=1 Tax=Trichuris trichiura TaxID=36087 RepID=A0A077YWT6_TRITR|nr:MRP-L46 domain containing protein [Trichuris trichiura]